MRPQRLNATVASLFMVGSACFAFGTVPAYAGTVGGFADGVTFFVGSLFFTAASLLQLIQAQSPEMAAGRDPAVGRLVWRAWLPHDRNWQAAATQFPGTLAFNVSTLFALVASLTAAQQHRVVWRPDSKSHSRPIPFWSFMSWMVLSNASKDLVHSINLIF